MGYEIKGIKIIKKGGVMLNQKYFLKKSSFKKGSFNSGFKKDVEDFNDYKYSKLMKGKKKTKRIKTIEMRSPVLKTGKYRKANYIRTTPKVKTVVVKKVTEVNYSLTTKIDHSDNMSSVKDQGMLGSCVGFATASLKEWKEKTEHQKEVLAGKKDHREGKKYDYSEQWIYWNCKKIDQWPGEDGTSIRCAMKVLNKIGVPTENAWPYSDSPVDIGEPKNWANLVARWAISGSYWRIENLIELKSALQDAPVILGVLVFQEWGSRSGYIGYPSNPDAILGGHAICAVGYNDDKGVVKFKNSWSKEWGDNGYGYLTYRYIDEFMTDAWATRDISVTKDMLKGTVNLI